MALNLQDKQAIVAEETHETFYSRGAFQQGAITH